MTTTLTLEELGRMYGTVNGDREAIIEGIRESLEVLGDYIPFKGDTKDVYTKLARIIFSEAELPIDFVGQGKDTHLVLGNHGAGVIVENGLTKPF